MESSVWLSLLVDPIDRHATTRSHRDNCLRTTEKAGKNSILAARRRRQSVHALDEATAVTAQPSSMIGFASKPVLFIERVSCPSLVNLYVSSAFPFYNSSQADMPKWADHFEVSIAPLAQWTVEPISSDFTTH